MSVVFHSGFLCNFTSFYVLNKYELVKQNEIERFELDLSVIPYSSFKQ